MFNIKQIKNISRVIVLFAAFGFMTNSAYAAYDVVKAKTVKKTGNINFLDMPEYEFLIDENEITEDFEENKVTPLFEDKLKKIFSKKNKIDSEITEETINEKDLSEVQENNDNTPKNEDDNQEKSDNQENADNNENEINEEELEKQQLQKKYKLYNSKEIDEKYKFKINADSMVYDDVEGSVVANGNVEIIAKEQGLVLKADSVTLDKASQTLDLIGNVRVIKQGSEMLGNSLHIDLNEENILMENPALKVFSFAISAQEGYLIANDIQMLNGSMESVRKKDFTLMSRGFLGFDAVSRDKYFGKYKENDDDSKDINKKNSYKIDAKEVVITCYKDHNTVLLKGSNVFYNDHKVIRNADIEIISDKHKDVIETNAPEAGNLRNFGTYIGYGHTFKLPKGQTFKFMPVLAYSDSSAGVGLIGRYRTKRALLDGGWNTASENLVVRGRYAIADSLMLEYGRHAYMREGFMGRMRSGYAAQLAYMKSYRVKDLNATFSNGMYAGLFGDYKKKKQDDRLRIIPRFRYMAQINKPLFAYKNPEQDFAFKLSAVAQGAGTVYGTGETHGLIRVGPSLSTRYKKWDSSIAYYLTGEHGETPFRFDRYRYGKSTITINERFYVNKNFAFGFRFFVTPMKDNYKEDLLTEAKIYVVAGPEDLKLALSYDFVRDIAHVNFMFLIGSENSRITFDKLTTQDIDGKNQRKDFYQSVKPVRIIKPENI